MNRNYVKNLLLNYHPTDLQENKFKQKMLKFLDTHADCFERTCPPGHFTASGWLVDKSGSKCLLLHHTKLDKWLQLGGHCDGDHNILNVAIKEAQEESGIINIEPVFKDIFDIDIHLIPQIKEELSHYHYDVRFLLQVRSDEHIVPNAESKSLQWFGCDTDSFPTKEISVTRMFDKWQHLIAQQTLGLLD